MAVEVFDATTTWTCPDGVTEVQVECWGGGSDGAAGSPGAGSAGGGGGAFAIKTAFSVTPATVYDVTVGANDPATAGDSSFDDGTAVLAKGSVYPIGGLTATSIGDTKFAGGDGGQVLGGMPIDTGGGGGGGSAGTGSAGNNGADTNGSSGGAGAAAVTGGGAGGNGGDDGANGTDATVPGGGGGAGGRNGSGGLGKPGRVRLTYDANVLGWMAAAALQVQSVPMPDMAHSMIDAGTMTVVSQAPTTGAMLSNQIILGGAFL